MTEQAQAAEGFDYSQYKTEPGDNLIQQISQTAVDLKDAQALVAALEDQLKEAKANVVHLGEKVLPELMDAAEMASFTTKEGIVVGVSERIRASIPAKTHKEAIAWLEENGEAGVIKRTFTIEFGRDDNKWADKFERDMKQRKKPLPCKRKTAVHPQTLAKTITDKLEAGVDVPMETFGAFRQRFSTVKVK
jgi:Ribonuclease G/E